MKKVHLIAILLLWAFIASSQNWINSSQSYTVKDPVFNLNYYHFKIPETFYLDSTGTFLSDDGGMVANYEVDYEPGITSDGCIDGEGNVNLFKYALKLTPEDLYYMESGKISKKTISPKVEVVNGVKLILVSFDYEETFDGEKTKGRGYVYLLPARGDGQTISNKSEFVIKLSFIYDFSEIPLAKQTVHKEIIKTLVKPDTSVALDR